MSEKYQKDISGMTFGTLKAIKPTGKVYGDSSMWLCECSCGHRDCPIYVVRPRRNITRKDWKPTCGVSRGNTNGYSEYYRHKNKTVQSNNTVGVAGVTYFNGEYIVRSMVNGKRKPFVCKTLEEAIQIRDAAELNKWKNTKG